MKAMENVKLGDEILISSVDGKTFSYSSVVAIPHGFNEMSSSFQVITTESGRQLKLTVDHLLLSGQCGTALSLKAAAKLKIKECVATITGEEVVATVSTAHGHGIYTLVTEADGLLVVNGIVASSFATNHLMANSFYNIYRWMNKLTPSFVQTNFVMSVINTFGDVVLTF
jgi:hypothetical protein